MVVGRRGGRGVTSVDLVPQTVCARSRALARLARAGCGRPRHPPPSPSSPPEWVKQIRSEPTSKYLSILLGDGKQAYKNGFVEQGVGNVSG